VQSGTEWPRAGVPDTSLGRKLEWDGRLSGRRIHEQTGRETKAPPASFGAVCHMREGTARRSLAVRGLSEAAAIGETKAARVQTAAEGETGAATN